MYEKPDEKGQSNIAIKPGSIYCRNLSIYSFHRNKAENINRILTELINP